MDVDSKRFVIKTLGCKVNQYESQLIREELGRKGFKESPSMDMADIYVVNTCTVTHRADSESRHVIGLCHKTNPRAKIVVTGCYVENNADNISFLPGVRHIVGNKDKSYIAAILENGAREDVEWPAISDFKGHVKAFVKIQDGCRNGCSYCKVPLVRPEPKSKPIDCMLKEVELLVSKGFREIVLTGICLGMWGEDLDPPGDLADALTALKGLKGDFRIRLSSIEPKYVSSSLIDLIAREARICKHLHIPLQSGDDEVLRRMKRPYTRREYSSLIRDIRSKVPGIGITTDVMVGFPGESEENFRNTLELVKEMQPARVHIFPFSRRDGTAACEYQDTLKRKDLKKRYDAIKAAAMEASYRYRKAFEGKVADVLVETKRHRQTGMLQGYSGNYIKIIFIGPDDLSGRIVPVKVGAVATDTTRGEII